MSPSTLWVFTLEARPLPDSPDYAEAGGAYVICYLKPGLADDPLKHAAAYVRGQDWEVVAVEDEPLRLPRDEAPDAKCFDQALADDEIYVFHMWPIDDVQHETRH